jgi:glycosyltransferase involved in cell wall biosynthesis
MSEFDVSVVIPAYNRAAFLPATIRSILNALPSRCEVIVVDDGSQEDQRPALNGFDGRVSLIRQTNGGPAKARNTGARAAKGRYLGFLDSDDSWEQPVPSRLLAQLEQAPAVAAAFADTAMGNPEEGYVSFITAHAGDRFSALAGKDDPSGLKVLEREPLFRLMSLRNVMFLGSFLVRREAFERLGGFDLARRGAEDWELFLRLVLSEPVGFSAGAPMSKYLKHEGGLSTDDDLMGRDHINTLESIRRHPSLTPALRAHVDAEWQRHMFNFAYGAYDRGNLPEARRRFLTAARRSGPAVRSLAYAGLASLPPGLVAGIRRLKQRLNV